MKQQVLFSPALLNEAKQGDVTAQIALADIYEEGRGVPQDLAQAVKWYRKAAEQGNPQAQYWLRRLQLHLQCPWCDD
jgi:TPR repeat protein